MDDNYTKGGLYTLPNYPDTVHAKQGGRGRRICDTSSFGNKTENEANARRIVACWNACTGIPTEQLQIDHYQGYEPWSHVKHLEAERDHFQSLAKDNGQAIIKTACELADVKAQRDALLAALEASPSIEHALPFGNVCTCSQCQFVRLRRAAITQATAPAATQPQPPKPYGCHNRAPIDTVCEPTCQYTYTALGQADQKCIGCRERFPGLTGEPQP